MNSEVVSSLRSCELESSDDELGSSIFSRIELNKYLIVLVG